jgi:hypothetical protein
MDAKHTEILKSIGKADEPAGSVDTSKYRHHPLVESLNLTDKEFKTHFGVIVHMINEQNICDQTPIDCGNTSRSHTRLVRNAKDQLEVISIPCEKVQSIVQIKSKYLIRNFADMYLNVLLNQKSIGPLVDPTKARLLKQYEEISKQDIIEYGLYVYGDMGIGKTFTSIALANQLALAGKTIAYISVPDFAYKLKQGFDKDSEINNELVEKMKRADVLFLDDMGAEDTSA